MGGRLLPIEGALKMWILAIIALVMVSCATENVRPAAYGAELAACTEKSATLTESIECENKVRTRYGRPLRDAGVDQ